jgi:hypothetical protein
MNLTGVTDITVSPELNSYFEIAASGGGYFLFMKKSINFIVNPTTPIMTRQNVYSSSVSLICATFPKAQGASY